jgi:hypothetical protein
LIGEIRPREGSFPRRIRWNERGFSVRIGVFCCARPTRRRATRVWVFFFLDSAGSGVPFGAILGSIAWARGAIGVVLCRSRPYPWADCCNAAENWRCTGSFICVSALYKCARVSGEIVPSLLLLFPSCVEDFYSLPVQWA